MLLLQYFLNSHHKVFSLLFRLVFLGLLLISLLSPVLSCSKEASKVIPVGVFELHPWQG